MALQKNYKTTQGFDCPEAYFMVKDCQYRKGQNTMYRVEIYKDKASRVAKLSPVGSLAGVFDYDLSLTDNVVAQTYKHIESLPGMSGAINV